MCVPEARTEKTVTTAAVGDSTYQIPLALSGRETLGKEPEREKRGENVTETRGE